MKKKHKIIKEIIQPSATTTITTTNRTENSTNKKE